MLGNVVPTCCVRLHGPLAVVYFHLFLLMRRTVHCIARSDISVIVWIDSRETGRKKSSLRLLFM